MKKLNILVTYYSLSGNTKKIAETISEAVSSNGHNVTVKSLSEITLQNFYEADLVFLGSACHDSDLAKLAIDFLEQIDQKPTFKLAGFVTHSTTMPVDTDRNRKLYDQWAGRCPETLERISKEKGFELLGYFHCQGVSIPPITEFIHNTIIPDEEEFKFFMEKLAGHPDEADLALAEDFARNVLGKVKE